MGHHGRGRSVGVLLLLLVLCATAITTAFLRPPPYVPVQNHWGVSISSLGAHTATEGQGQMKPQPPHQSSYKHNRKIKSAPRVGPPPPPPLLRQQTAAARSAPPSWPAVGPMARPSAPSTTTTMTKTTTTNSPPGSLLPPSASALRTVAPPPPGRSTPGRSLLPPLLPLGAPTAGPAPPAPPPRGPVRERAPDCGCSRVRRCITEGQDAYICPHPHMYIRVSIDIHIHTCVHVKQTRLPAQWGVG